MTYTDDGWERRVHPRGGTRWYLRGRHGVVWIAQVPRAGTDRLRVDAGYAPTLRAARRRSSRALTALRRAEA